MEFMFGSAVASAVSVFHVNICHETQKQPMIAHSFPTEGCLLRGTDPRWREKKHAAHSFVVNSKKTGDLTYGDSLNSLRNNTKGRVPPPQKKM